MKRLFLQNAVMFFVSLLLLTSCMGEGRNVDSGMVFGVVRYDYLSGKNLLDVADDVAFYSSRFEYDYEGDCFFVTYEIDHDLPENSYESVEKRGYYEVYIGEVKEKVDKWNVYPMLAADTSVVLPDELPLSSAIVEGGFVYIKGRVFMISNLQKSTYQKMSWTLRYDADNMSFEERGTRYYNLFLRSTATQNTNSREAISFANAFEMRSYLQNVVQKEKELGGESFFIRFNYPSAISADGQITWEYQDLREAVKVNELVFE